MERFIYGENTTNTKEVLLERAGFSIDGREAFYIIDDSKENCVVYFSKASQEANLKAAN